MKNNYHERYKLTWVGLNRVFDAVNRLIGLNEKIPDLHINTYKYLFNQCTDEEKQFLNDKFTNLQFIFKDE